MNGMEQEAGESDNRMDFNPGEFPATKVMEDEGTFRVTLLCKQTTGGQAQILDIEKVDPAQPGAAPETENPAEEAQPGEEPDSQPASPPMNMDSRGMGTGNPAIDRLMSSGKS